jgi:hypothetical protein
METPKHHPWLSPSKLDILAVCPLFHSGPPGEAAKSGTAQHEYAEALLHNYKTDATEKGAALESGDRDNVEWYVDYVRATASGPLEIELSLELLDDKFTLITFGTLDAAAGPDIFDYKSDRELREHTRQMACYALMRMRAKGLPSVTAHLCYGRLRKIVKHTFTEESAAALVNEVIVKVYDKAAVPVACEYCGWCSEAKTCSAVTGKVEEVALARQPEVLSEWEPTAITDPAMLGRALVIARVVSQWATAIQDHAKIEMEKGVTVPGWGLMERAGQREITDINAAFKLCGVSEQSFLSACKVRLGELEGVYAIEKGLKKAAAKRELNELLESVTKRGKGFKILVENKEA